MLVVFVVGFWLLLLLLFLLLFVYCFYFVTGVANTDIYCFLVMSLLLLLIVAYLNIAATIVLLFVVIIVVIFNVYVVFMFLYCLCLVFYWVNLFTDLWYCCYYILRIVSTLVFLLLLVLEVLSSCVRSVSYHGTGFSLTVEFFPKEFVIGECSFFWHSLVNKNFLHTKQFNSWFFFLIFNFLFSNTFYCKPCAFILILELIRLLCLWKLLILTASNIKYNRTLPKHDLFQWTQQLWISCAASNG